VVRGLIFSSFILKILVRRGELILRDPEILRQKLIINGGKNLVHIDLNKDQDRPTPLNRAPPLVTVE
jgi:hypothetical protein